MKQYKGDIEQHLSAMIGQPVTIDTMETSWYWFEPVLKLGQVSVSDAQDHVLKLNKLLVGINLFSSLWHWQLEPGILYVDDVHLTVRQGEDSWEVDGLRQDQETMTLNSDSFLPILGWVLSQQRVVIKNAYILIYLKDKSILPINNLHLTATNHYGRYRLKGSAELAQTTPTEISVLADLLIDPNALTKTKGRVYLSLQHLLPAQWQQFFPETNYRLEGGAGNIELWFDLAKAQVTQLQTKCLFENMIWSQAGKDKNHFIQSLQANLAWNRAKDGWQISGDQLHLTMAGLTWPENKVRINYKKSQQTYHVFVERLLLQPLLAANIDWPEVLKPVLAAHPQGELFDTQFEMKGKHLDLFLTRFVGLSWQGTKNSPAVSNLSGALYWKPALGRLAFDGENTVIAPHKLPPLQFTQINGEFDWQESSQGRHINMERLVLNNPDLTLSAQGSFDEPSGDVLNLTAEFSTEGAQRWMAYIPNSLLKPKLYEWLQKDVKRIAKASGQLTINGPLAEFPFDKQQGEFNITSHIQGLDLLINDEWPLSRDIDASLRFDKRNMEADILHADLQGILIDQMNLRIDDLGLDHETLLLHGKIAAPADKVKSYVLASPLSKQLAKLSKLDLQGDLGIDLRLEVPLYAENDNVLVRGSIAFNNNLVKIHHDLKDIELRNLSGNLDFDEHGVTDSALRAVLMDDPVTMHIKSFRTEHPYTEVSIEGNTTIDMLKNKLNLPIFSLMQGHLNIETTLILTDDPGDLDHIRVQTTLEHVAIDLPAPFGKVFGKKAPLVAHIYFNPEKGFRVRSNYDNQLSSDLWFASDKNTYLLKNGQIRLGKGQAADQKVAGIQIVGSLPGLNMDQWRQVLAKFPSDATSPNLLEKVKLVDVVIGSLSILKYEYKQVAINVAKLAKDDWQIGITQEDVAANLRYQRADNSVSGNIKRLYIPKSVLTSKGNNASLSKLNPDQIPNLDITINEFKIGEREIGNVLLKSTSTHTDWRLENAVIQSPVYQLTMKGDWQKTAKQNRTVLEANLQIKNLAKSLQQWSIPPVVEAHRGSIQFEGGWQGGIGDFSIKKITGDMSMRFKDGRITNLSPETEEKLGLGKLLSILSLQTIPRRLKLDFSDLAEGGYSFDEFKGSFKLKNGVMTTTDSSIDGPVAYASMKGELDLVKQLYDLELFVSPHITASLPVVATIAGGPIAGVATWFASKIINRGMQKISGYTYKVTGPWLDPVVQQVSIIKSKKASTN